ncbi:N-alpha-acetyltransferase 50-like isoform X2 [Lineus longissimus]|uniref:N-alpha-acetyltransferase 50-like isoform X2 n=1 Tax=Lineus longissimus TaxID=88925 RepID=UPI00315D5CA1
MTRGRIELGDVTPHNIKQLKRLNQVVFPVSYNEKFYKDVLEVGELAKLAYFNDIVVGAVCCRVDTSEPNKRRLYIMTLGCLAQYRKLGIGTKMLEHVLSICEKDGNFDSVFLDDGQFHFNVFGDHHITVDQGPRERGAEQRFFNSLFHSNT